MNERLYHYTTADGFLGILSSEQIRATNYSFLNDSSELAYGLRIMEDVLDRRLYGAAADRLKFLLTARAALRKLSELSDTYVACFSTKCDDLSQWRGYGVTNSDRYCLGFDQRQMDLVVTFKPRFSAKTSLPLLSTTIHNRLLQLNALLIKCQSLFQIRRPVRRLINLRSVCSRMRQHSKTQHSLPSTSGA